MQISLHPPSHPPQYRCQFFSDVSVTLDDIPRVPEVHFTLEVSLEEVVNKRQDSTEISHR